MKVKKGLSVLLVLAMVISLLPGVASPASAVKVTDYQITLDSDGKYDVNGSGDNTTLASALDECKEAGVDGILTIQFGDGTNALKVKELLLTDVSQALISATYMGKVEITRDDSLDSEADSYGVCVPAGVNAVFNALEVADAVGTAKAEFAVVYVSGGSLTVNSGASITVNGSSDCSIKAESGSVTIEGGSTVKAANTLGSAVALQCRGSASLVVKGGTIEACGKKGIAVGHISSGEVSVTGGEIKATCSSDSDNAGLAIGANTGKVTVSGGIISSKGSKFTAGAIIMGNATNAVLEITDNAVITGVNSAICVFSNNCKNGTVNITGGSLTATGENSFGILNYMGTVNISGGKLSSQGTGIMSSAVICASGNSALSADLVVSGTAELSSASPKNIILYNMNETGDPNPDSTSASVFGKTVYGSNAASVIIGADSAPSVFKSTNYTEGKVSALMLSGNDFAGWASDQPRTTVASTENPAKLSSFSAGAKIYLKTKELPKPDYTITGGPTSFKVNGSGTYLTLGEALKACNDKGTDGILDIQLGSSGSPLQVMEMFPNSDTDHTPNELISATYSGSVTIADDKSASYGAGLYIPAEVSAVFKNLLITAETDNTDYIQMVSVMEKGVLWVSDGTTIKGDKPKSRCISNQGTVNVTGGNITSTGSESYGINDGSSKSVSLSGGTISASGAQSIAVKNNNSFTMTGGSIIVSEDAWKGLELSGTANISGGAISSNGTKSTAVTNSGDLTISGSASISTVSEIGMVVYYNAKLKICGGSITATGADSKAILVSRGGLIMTGGTVSASGNNAFENYTISCNCGTVDISGGTVSYTGPKEDGYALNQIGVTDSMEGDTPSSLVLRGNAVISGGAHGSGIHNRGGYTEVKISENASVSGYKYGVYNLCYSKDDKGTVILEGGSVIASSENGCALMNNGNAAISGGQLKGSGENSKCVTNAGDLTVSGGKLEGSGKNFYCVNNVDTDDEPAVLTVSGGNFSADGEDSAVINNAGKMSITGGSFMAGNGTPQRSKVVSNSASKTTNSAISGGVFTSNDPAGYGVYNNRFLTIAGSAEIVSTSGNTIYMMPESSTSMFGKTVHCPKYKDTAISLIGAATGSGYKIASSNYASTALIATIDKFGEWTRDEALENSISKVNGDSISTLTTGANAAVTDIYLKTGDKSAVLVSGTLGTADNGKITGLKSGTKYKVAMGSVIYYAKANGELTLKATDAAALTGTEITGLINGSTYKVEEIVVSSGDSGDSPTTPSNNAPVVVDGKTQTAGKSETSIENGKTKTTVTLASDKLKDILDSTGKGSTVTIPIPAGSSAASGRLDGQSVKNMESKEAILEIKTDTATYTLPAAEINIDAVSARFGESVSLGNITVNVSVAEPSNSTVKVVENAAKDGGFAIAVQAVEFKVNCTYNGQTVDVSEFNSYVERLIAIPAGVDPSKITTGIVVEPSGAVRHVPTEIVVIGGKQYAKINSLTNSVYSVIYNPMEFSDLTNHWAKEAVNNMGSRLVVNGVGNNSFEPDRDITRAEFATIVVKALGLGQGTGSGRFSDVKTSDWFCGYIETASAHKLILGFEDGTFRPDERITREQAMAITARAMELTCLKASLESGKISSLLSAYTDSTSISDYAKASVAKCVDTGIVNGNTSTTIAPQSNISRAETAVIMERLLKKSKLID